MTIILEFIINFFIMLSPGHMMLQGLVSFGHSRDPFVELLVSEQAKLNHLAKE